MITSKNNVNNANVKKNTTSNKRHVFKNKPKYQKQTQILKITLSGFILGVALALSFIEIPISIMGANILFRFFDNLIFVLAITIIGVYYTLLIALIEPWLHFLIHSHLITDIIVDFCVSSFLILSFVLIYYYLLKVNKTNAGDRTKITKTIVAGAILVPLNAIINVIAIFIKLFLIAPPTSISAKNPLFYFLLLLIQLACYMIFYLIFIIFEIRMQKFSRI